MSDDVRDMRTEARRGDPPFALCEGCRASWEGALFRSCLQCGGRGVCTTVCPCVGVRRDADHERSKSPNEGGE